jgi:hypothetical protein
MLKPGPIRSAIALRNRCCPKRFAVGGSIKKVPVDFYRCSSVALFLERDMATGEKQL